ncbi:unnamed protein product [Rotaria sp. Silwood1]|nr:unnamed protein product [Rotaria sp. Silwood1]CAF1600750.1 unnamed protein product [Rotaria sp. Silwood1]CAF3685685.1 unnamed protein product [Rotaria sp. Silwood1]CAF4805931.1 unnamed protein product [Rotaria sp. Silwood1]
MSIVNSFTNGAHEDDSDITIINPSIVHEHNDEYVPIITRLKQVNNSSEIRQATNIETNNNILKNENNDGKQEYIFIDHNPNENAKQLEQILIHYIRDLKQETNTQNDCDQQLITRLMDIIRPVYTNDEKKLNELDNITKEIASLHDKRYIEQKEKIEQLHTEICQLNKMLLTKNELLIYNDNNQNDSMFQPKPSINDYDQWTEIEDDAKKLQEIVQTQRDQIEKIVTLISQTATASTTLNPTDVPINDTETIITEQPTKPNANTNIINSLLRKVQYLTGHHTQQEPATNDSLERTTLENHSPGISPSQSLATLTVQSLQPTIIDQKEKIEESQDKYDEELNDKEINNKQLIIEEPRTPTNTPIMSMTPKETKKCPVCNIEFSLTTNDEEVYDHIEKCLFPSNENTVPKDYECPYCNRKLPGNEEVAYIQHLSDCINREF